MDDQTLPETALPPPTPTRDATSPSTTSTPRKEVDDGTTVTPGNLKRTLTNPSISSEPSASSLKQQPELTAAPGFRAAEAYVRPAPIHTNGRVAEYGFDLRRCEFVLKLEATRLPAEDRPTVVFLPEHHFPRDQCAVEVSGGKWEISIDVDDDPQTQEGGGGESSASAGALVQRLRWWHSDGPQTLRVTGLVRPRGALAGSAEEAGYLEQCQQYGLGLGLKDCSVM